MQGLYVGIDLGTTFSLAAIIQDGRPLIIENAIGETLTPSVVSEDEDSVCVASSEQPSPTRA